MGAVQGISYQDVGNKRGIVELVITSLAAPLLGLLKAKNGPDVVLSFEKHRPPWVPTWSATLKLTHASLRLAGCTKTPGAAHNTYEQEDINRCRMGARRYGDVED